MSATKNDLLISAFEEIRISGITVNPTPADKALALRHLETMMAQLEGRNICVGYNFEDTPNMNSPSNVDRAYWYPIIMLLADRLLPSFGKVATPEFARNRSGAQSYLSSVCAKLHPVPHSSRMPKAPGPYFYPASDPGPALNCTTHTMYIGDTDDFTESFISYLAAGETIASYVLTADTGLTVDSESLSTPIVSYRITADGNNGVEETLQAKIVATTSDDRVITRLINFQLVSADVID
jgi:hypothetical protein